MRFGSGWVVDLDAAEHGGDRDPRRAADAEAHGGGHRAAEPDGRASGEVEGVGISREASPVDTLEGETEGGDVEGEGTDGGTPGVPVSRASTAALRR